MPLESLFLSSINTSPNAFPRPLITPVALSLQSLFRRCHSESEECRLWPQATGAGSLVQGAVF